MVLHHFLICCKSEEKKPKRTENKRAESKQYFSHIGHCIRLMAGHLDCLLSIILTLLAIFCDATFASMFDSRFNYKYRKSTNIDSRNRERKKRWSRMKCVCAMCKKAMEFHLEVDTYSKVLSDNYDEQFSIYLLRSLMFIFTLKFMRTNELSVMNVMYLSRCIVTLIEPELCEPNNYTHNGKSLVDSFNYCSSKRSV